MSDVERKRWIKAIWPFVMDQRSQQEEWDFFDQWHCILFRNGDTSRCNEYR